MPDSPFAFEHSTLRIGDGPEIPVAGGTFTFERDGGEYASYVLDPGAFQASYAVDVEFEASHDWRALFDAATRWLADEERFRDEAQERANAVRDWVNGLLSPELIEAGVRFEWHADPGPQEFATTPRMAALLAVANRRADELEAVRRAGRDDQIEPTSVPIVDSDADWTARGETCAHVCGGDADHVCDARATTTLRYTLPSGGTRTMPICGACYAAETAMENAHA